MRKTLCSLALLGLTGAGEVTPSQMLLEDCSAQVVIANTDPSKVTALQYQSAAHCQGYLKGFLEGFTMAVDLTQTPRIFCYPEGQTVGDMAAGVVGYLSTHPERQEDQSMGVVLWWALVSIYPCT